MREQVSFSAAFRTPELNAVGEKRYVANWDKILTSLSPYYILTAATLTLIATSL